MHINYGYTYLLSYHICTEAAASVNKDIELEMQASSHRNTLMEQSEVYLLPLTVIKWS